MKSLRCCLLAPGALTEAAPKLIDWRPIAHTLIPLRIAIMKQMNVAVLRGRWNEYGGISKLLNNALRRFGNINAIFITKYGPPGPEDRRMVVAGSHKNNNDNIILEIDPWTLAKALTYENMWVTACKQIAITISHELIHSWQRSRMHPEFFLHNKHEKDFEHYLQNPHEITAWAHDIVNELGAEDITSFLFTDGRDLTKYLQMYSSEFGAVEEYLSDTPVDLAQRLRKRLLRAVVDIAQNSITR